jgi:hypothetical protein
MDSLPIYEDARDTGRFYYGHPANRFSFDETPRTRDDMLLDQQRDVVVIFIIVVSCLFDARA